METYIIGRLQSFYERNEKMRCSKCGSMVIKRGHRQTKHARKPIYHSKKCNRSFTYAEDHFANKTYPAKAIIYAFNLGYIFE